jgi:hypothetical protein
MDQSMKGVCPVCNGTCRVPAGFGRYKDIIAGYDRETDTFECSNCGGQYMFGTPRGEVLLNKEGQPCHHSYKSQTVGRCLTQYTCVHCDDSYKIDSGD